MKEAIPPRDSRESSEEGHERNVEMKQRVGDLESWLADYSVDVPYQRTVHMIILAAQKLINAPSEQVGERDCKEQLQMVLALIDTGSGLD